MLESLAHIAVAGATAVAWFGAGSLLLAATRSSGDAVLDALNRLGAGAVAFVLLTFTAGYLGLLYSAAYVPLFVFCVAVGAVSSRRLVAALPRPDLSDWPRWQLALLALIAFYVLADLLVTCAPVSAADALAYHAAAPEIWIEHHRLVELPWSWQTYQPFSTEMLVLDGMLLWDSVQGAFAPLLLGLAGVSVVGLVAHRLAGRSIAVLATTLYLAQPFAVWLFTSTFVEPAAAFTAALALANLLWFRRTRNESMLALAGVFTGATAGMKYVAAGAASVLAVAALALLRRSLSARRAALFALPALAVAAPWYVKNLVLTGDPAYPLLRGWPNSEASRAAHDSFANYGYGHSPLDLLLLPFRLLTDAEPFDRAEFITPLFLAFAPVALLDRRARRAVAATLAGVAAYVFLWFLAVQDSRYLLSAMPALAVVAAVGIRALSSGRAVGRAVAVAGTVGALAIGVGVTAVYASQFAAVVTGRQSEDSFLREVVSYDEGTAWLNRHVPDDAVVALDYVFVLHSRQHAFAWTADALPGSAGPEETRAFFREYGVTHALIFAADGTRRRQLGYVHARRIARVTVHAVRSRTRSETGPPEQMDVYRLSGGAA